MWVCEWTIFRQIVNCITVEIRASLFVTGYHCHLTTSFWIYNFFFYIDARKRKRRIKRFNRKLHAVNNISREFLWSIYLSGPWSTARRTQIYCCEKEVDTAIKLRAWINSLLCERKSDDHDNGRNKRYRGIYIRRSGSHGIFCVFDAWNVKFLTDGSRRLRPTKCALRDL